MSSLNPFNPTNYLALYAMAEFNILDYSCENMNDFPGGMMICNEKLTP